MNDTVNHASSSTSINTPKPEEEQDYNDWFPNLNVILPLTVHSWFPPPPSVAPPPAPGKEDVLIEQNILKFHLSQRRFLANASITPKPSKPTSHNLSASISSAVTATATALARKLLQVSSGGGDRSRRQLTSSSEPASGRSTPSRRTTRNDRTTARTTTNTAAVDDGLGRDDMDVDKPTTENNGGREEAAARGTRTPQPTTTSTTNLGALLFSNEEELENEPPIVKGITIPTEIPPLKYEPVKPVPKPSYRELLPEQHQYLASASASTNGDVDNNEVANAGDVSLHGSAASLMDGGTQMMLLLDRPSSAGGYIRYIGKQIQDKYPHPFKKT